VKENPTLIQSLGRYVYLPIETPPDSDKAKAYGVHHYPTFAVWNCDGETVGAWSTYRSAEEWVGVLGEVLSDPVTLGERKTRYRDRPRAMDAVVLGKTAYTRQQFADADVYLADAVKLDHRVALDSDARYFQVRSRFDGLRSGDFTSWDVQAFLGEILAAPDLKPRTVLEIARRLWGVVDSMGAEVVRPYLEMVHPLVLKAEGEEHARRRAQFLAQYAMSIEQDAGKALPYKRETMPEGWETHPGQLNHFAWWCFEQNVNLEEAEELARRAIDLCEPGSDKANILDTLAEIVNARGNPTEACDLIDSALEMNPESTYLKKQQARFRKIMRTKATS
jgi:tetratricopeptide (TPR) repeat protein